MYTKACFEMTSDLKKALEVLKDGGTILYPTDTIWGIGCDATNDEAIEKIYKIKQRSDTKSMLVLLDESWRVKDFVNEMPGIAMQLIELADKPLTIIYPGAKNLPENLINQDGTIGIRVTSDEFCKRLIQAFNKPLVSTSANISGWPSPRNFDEISEGIKMAVDYTVKWRQDDQTKSNPSSIIKFGLKGEIEILRK
jgi:L-threonylcarbamoyladenylate synthase